MSRKPDFTIFVPVPRTNGNGVQYMRAGAAWTRTAERDGKEFISCKIDLLPVQGWDGTCVLHTNDREHDDGSPF